MQNRTLLQLMCRITFLSCAAMIAAPTLTAQSALSHDNAVSTSIPSAESSSLEAAAPTGAGALDAVPAAPASEEAGAGQNGGDNKRFYSLSHMAFEGGGGFSAPIGNDTPYITWGGHIIAGAGLHLSQRFTLLGEFQFLDNKLPGAFVAAGGGQTGNSHIISLTVDPVIDLFPKRVNSAYVTGGGGYYYKSTNFNVLGGYDFYGYPVFITANSFSSSQGGFNVGLGFTHRLGGVYGDGQMKLFVEARYLYIHTPPLTESNGLGITELIPVTFGIRW